MKLFTIAIAVLCVASVKVVRSDDNVMQDDAGDGQIIIMDDGAMANQDNAVVISEEDSNVKEFFPAKVIESERTVVVVGEGSVYDAVQALFAQLQDFVVSYDLLTEEEINLIKIRENRFSTGGKPLAWERAAKEVLSQVDLNLFHDGVLVKIGAKEVVGLLYGESESRKLSFNHTRIDPNFSGGVDIYTALCTIRDMAGININFDYMKPEHRGIFPTQSDAAAAEGQVVVTQQPVESLTTYAVPVGQKIVWRLVMQEILGPKGYMFVEENGTVKPMPKEVYAKHEQDKINAKPLVTRMRRINHADPETLVEKIKLMKGFKHANAFIEITFGKNEKIKFFKSSGGNTIQSGSSGEQIGASISGSAFNRLERPRSVVGVLYADIEENIENIEEQIAMLDVRERQVLIEALILDISDGMKHEMGVQWGDIAVKFNSQAPYNEPQSFYQFDKDGNVKMKDTEVQTGTDADGNPIMSTIQVADLVPRMLSGNDLVNLADWSGKLARNRFGVSPISFDAVIKMIEGDQHSRMLGNPVITVGDHGEALIQISKITPVEQSRVSYDSYGGAGSSRTATETEWLSLQTGYTLWVSPEISEDGKHVRLSVHPQVTEIGGTVYASRKEWQSENLQDREKNYEVTSQELDTRVIVPSGQALLMGGLTRTRTMATESKVPILGDIPLLGRLFRYDSTENWQSHLVLIIRPTVLDEEEPNTGFEDRSMKMINAMSKGTGKTLDPEMGTSRYKGKEKKTIDKIKSFFKGDNDETEETLPPVETEPIESLDLRIKETPATE